jgi:hypothetical protein
MMDHKADVYAGTLLLSMARDAREEGDLVTAELLFAEAMGHFVEGGSLRRAWAKFRSTPRRGNFAKA